MRILSSEEIEQVNGAGFIQDSLADAGEKVGSLIGDTGISVVKTVANALFPPLAAGIGLLDSFGLLSGGTIGRLVGYGSGAFIEGMTSSFIASFKGQFH
ncbi:MULTISPECIES: hypothetical protein [Enterobacterales]|uniref:hypothetical protein n=1 Tax=Enterobacterales TaxID=91347 RepID=UPI002ED86ADB